MARASSTGGVGIFGCGGSNITPFGTPTEFSEDEIYATLRAGYDLVRDVRPLLMICHTPPFDTKCDRILSGKPVGSTAARQFIEEVKPEVCISGHIHESAGVDQIGPTQIFNAGPFKGGGYIVVRTSTRRRAAGREARISLTCPLCRAPINRFASTPEKSPTDGRWCCATRSGYCGASGRGRAGRNNSSAAQ